MSAPPATADRLALNLQYLARRMTLPLPDASMANRAPARAAVVTWDLTHNPVGRAHVLYRLLQAQWDVELIGPMWPRFGHELWQPIRDEGLRVRSFPAADLIDVWTHGAAIALAETFDLIVICKGRLPGMLLGLLLAEQSRCPVILDIDEDERAFDTRPSDGPPAQTLLAEPFGQYGTKLAMRSWPLADAVTVSNPVLQRRFGGRIVRHARDERIPLGERAPARRRLGFADDDLVLAFIGTARAHKGLDRVLAAIEAIGEKRIKLLFAGVATDPATRERLRRIAPEQVRVVDHVGIADIGTYLAAADLVPILQDPDAVVSQTQIPARLSDALQHGIPVLAADVPPLRDLHARGAIQRVGPDGLEETLRRLLAAAPPPPDRDRLRRIFEDEFSDAVNRVRLDAAVAEAKRRSSPFGARASDALKALRAATREAVRARNANPAARSPARPAPVGAATYDIALFWKQNDSRLFGRRSDMVAKYLRHSGRVRRMVQFDQRVSMDDLRRMAAAAAARRPTVGAMACLTTIAAALGVADEPGLARRLFVTGGQETGGQDARPTLGGRPAEPVEDFAAHVAAALAENQMDPARTIAWGFPVVWGFAEMVRRLGFRAVVVDLVDDQRTWQMTDTLRAEIEAEYAESLTIADVVLTNCTGNQALFRPLRPDIQVIPNGAEIEWHAETMPLPQVLAGIAPPIIGYVGNLRDRIDWEIITHVARARPDWSVVLIGPQADDATAAPDPQWPPNLHLPGPVPYEAARACLRHFQVGIVPHLACEMTASMNPLKIYNYLAAGLPVVATAIPNLEGLADLITIAPDADGFVAAIAAALSRQREDRTPAARVQEFAWPRRIEAMLRSLDAGLHGPGARPA